ncbi:phage tail protein [Halomonadaceae bacterium KBTZ08]
MKRADLEALLPAVFQDAIAEGTPLDALLEAAARLPEPEQRLLANVDRLFDPRRTHNDMVAFLAAWVDLDRFLIRRASDNSGGELATGSGPLRELCAAAAELSRDRGTRQGLTHFLEIATGQGGFRIEENRDRHGTRRPFHLLVTAPPGAEPHAELIHAIITYEKPAYVTYNPHELRFEEGT